MNYIYIIMSLYILLNVYNRIIQNKRQIKRIYSYNVPILFKVNMVHDFNVLNTIFFMACIYKSILIYPVILYKIYTLIMRIEKDRGDYIYNVCGFIWSLLILAISNIFVIRSLAIFCIAFYRFQILYSLKQ